MSSPPVAVLPLTGERLIKYGVGVVLLANLAKILAGAATRSYAAWFNVRGIEADDFADEAFYTVGALALLGAGLLLIVRG